MFKQIKMKRNILFVLMVTGLFLQSVETSGKKKDPPVDFWSIESSIIQILNEIKETKDDSLAFTKHKQIEEILAQAFLIPSAYTHKFDSLRTIGKIYAPRKKFRIINWNQSKRDGTHQHFALIVLPGGKKMPNKVIRLTDLSDSIVKPEQRILGANEWFGALYYKIIPKKKGKDKKAYYTLLGLDMNNLKTKKKIIEILSFSEDGQPQFGAPIIEMNRWTKHRVIFEFAVFRGMYLEYNRYKRMIEFDHLAPLMPYLVGEYEYYEPDMYRDGLKFKNGHWKHYKEIQKESSRNKVNKRSLPKPPKHIKLVKPTDEEGQAEEDENNPGTESSGEIQEDTSVNE